MRTEISKVQIITLIYSGGYARRGDVFICRSDYTNQGSVENKSRPVVVVSNDTGNSTSTTCVVCPITTRPEATLPVHVKYFNTNTPQVVLCEQIKTVSINDLTNYCGHLSDEVMEKVDEALRVQLVLPKDTVSYSMNEALKIIEDAFEKVLKDKVTQIEEKKDVRVDEVALNIAKMVENLTASMIKEEKDREAVEFITTPPKIETEEAPVPSSVPKPPENFTRRMTQIEKFNARYNKESQTPSSTPKQETPKKTRKMKYFETEEQMRQFLEDFDKLPVDAVASKYGMEVKSVYNHRYLVRKRLGV